MNTLAYGLLSLIAIGPCSGYDLTQRIQLFWNAKHSQIYPLLAQLEENGLVRFELVPQSDKPDKKVYSITEAGREAIRSWLPEPTDPPVHRDEFVLKVFSLWLAGPEDMLKLLAEKEQALTEKLARLKKRTEELRQIARREDGTVADEWPSPFFGPSILLRKALATTHAELDWCREVMDSAAKKGAPHP